MSEAVKKVRRKTLLPFALPEDYYNKLSHRIEPIIDYWGQHCRWVPFQIMAFSCYSQGVMDGVQLVKQRGMPQAESDYEI